MPLRRRISYQQVGCLACGLCVMLLGYLVASYHLSSTTCYVPSFGFGDLAVRISSTPSVNSAPTSNRSSYKIPNIYHFVRFNQSELKFVEMLAIVSALRLNPTMVMVHTNNLPQGRYWDMIRHDRRLVLVYREPPKHIYGQKPGWIQHASDLARIHILQQHGGIYMDNDCIMLRPIDSLRTHQCVVAKSKIEKYLGNMFIMAAVGCRFLDMYDDLYKTQYKPSEWYYNAGELPTTAILEPHPDIAFVVDEGIQQNIVTRFYKRDEPLEILMGEYDVLHLLYNHKNYMVNDLTAYDHSNVYTINNTFTRLARLLLSTLEVGNSTS